MFGKMVEMSGHAFARPSGRIKTVLGLVGGFALLGGSQAMALSTSTLFTTVQDFTGWSNGGGSPVTSFGPSTAYDSDGSAVDGLGSSTPGAAGTPGSMAINTGGNAIGYTYTVFSSPNLLYNVAAMQQIDPGFTTGGTTVAASNTMYYNYSVPNWTGPDEYYQFGIDLSYPGDSYYGLFFDSSTINDGVIDGLQTYTAVIPYTITANSGGGNFSISPAINAGVYGSGIYGIDNTINGPFYVDDFAVASVAVPEPATLGLFGTALSMLVVRRRRKA